MRQISSPDAPKAIGPYVQAVMAEGKFVFISGQLPLDPNTGEILSGDMKEQVRRAMLNIGAILKAAGLHFNDLVKTTIYLTDISLFQEVNEVYASFFTREQVPARVVVQVSALPLGGKVEIEGIALVPASKVY